MIDLISDKFLRYLIYKKILKERHYSNLDYILRNVLFNTFLTFILVLLSFFLGCFKEFLIIGLIFNVFRKTLFLDGFHTTHSKCMKITIVYIVSLSYLSHLLNELLNINFFLISILFGFLSIYFMDCKTGKKIFIWVARFL